MTSHINFTSSNKSSAHFTAANLTCYTSIAWRIFLSNNQHLAIATAYSLTILPVALFNGALSLALYKTEQWKSKMKFLIFVLSLSDTFTGLVHLPAAIILATRLKYTRCCWFEMATTFTSVTNVHLSYYLLMAIAFQRYLKITSTIKMQPQLGRIFLSNKGTRITAMLLFPLAILHGLVATYFFGHTKSNIPNMTMMCPRILTFAVVFAVYFRLNFTLKKERKMAIQHGFNNRIHTRAFKIIVLVLCIYTVSYIPALATDTWTAYYSYFLKSAGPIEIRFAHFLSFSFAYLNCALNAIIFTYTNKTACRYILELISKCIPGGQDSTQERETNSLEMEL